MPVQEFSDDEYLIMLTQGGYIKKTALSAFGSIRANGLIAISLEDDDQLRWVRRAKPSDDVILGSSNGMAIRFRADSDQLRPLGRATRGVRAMALNDGDRLVSMDIITEDSDDWVLVITAAGYGKRTAVDEFRCQNRAGKGLFATKFKTAKVNDSLATVRIVKEEDEVLIVTSRGIVIRQDAGMIPTQSRLATGVRVQRLDSDDAIVGVTIVPAALADSAEIA